MPTPSLIPSSTEELRCERDKVASAMTPYSVEILKRLREAGDIEFKEEELLDRYETLTWLIGE